MTFASAHTEAIRSRATSAERTFKGNIGEERGRVAQDTLCEQSIGSDGMMIITAATPASVVPNSTGTVSLSGR